ncbi:sensor histidine kinase [Hyalangium rubrum]|uniref:histidine kinase n=1 Tax=Hyalangium rubrum TaxID=3103134 RepID=A0ABU5H6E4_9BACT|nr:ATP-binding protein [Hyalangium sp. s54d21]MDY7228915.1 ATP-binding protein [Hyalangium sp. s54d21]
MSATPAETPQVLNPEQVVRGLHPLMMAGSFILSLAVTLQYVGQWRLMAWAFGLSVLRILANVLLSKVFNRWLAPNTVEWIRMVCNVSGVAGIGLIAGWSLLLWIYIPFAMLWIFGMEGQSRLRALTYLVLMDTTALLSGADPFQPVAFTLLAVLIFRLTEKRAELLQQSLEHIIHQREQLSQAQGQLRVLHERALEQEKFSSLGMMAAGVAHEINNPMAFVTSNVHSLFKDLQQEPVLPAPLKEYVDEVLPATLDGIKRVNAIVSDLRRFARGDPEAYAEYDLNAEAEAAMRIAQGQLGHCRVEVALGEVGLLVGRPRQIVQVLVNLLVNAGQATGSTGVVRLSTRRQGEGVCVEIRDTGAGMTPETLRNLFQPFFTTKPPGMGMGLGLAVAHGLITGQGGHIQVESEPGKGSCFTLHLPRVAHRAALSSNKSQGVTLAAG